MKRLLLKNSALQGLIFASTMISTLVLYAIIGRVYGAASLGEIVFWMTLYRLFFSIGDFGVSTVLKRDLVAYSCKANQDKYSAAASLKIIELSGAVIILFILNLLNVEFEYDLEMGLVVLLFTGIRNFSEISYSALMSQNNFLTPFIIIFILESCSLLMLVFLVSLHSGLLEIFIFNTILSLVAYLAISRYVYRNLGLAFLLPTSFSAAVVFIKRSSSVGFGAAFNMLAFKADTLLLAAIVNPVAVGLYNAAYTLVNSTRILGSSVANGALPILSSKHSTNVQELIVFSKQMLAGILAAGCVVALGLWFIGPVALHLIFGEEFIEATGALLILSVSIPFAFVNMGAWIVSVAAHEDKLALKVILIGSSVNLVLNVLLIPIFSFQGAAWATLITEILLFFLYMTMMIRWLRRDELSIAQS